MKKRQSWGKLRPILGLALCFSLGFLTTITLSTPVFALQNDSQALEKYRKGDFFGAIRLWAPMAIGGNPEAQFYIGDMYQNGLGVKENTSVARMLYEEAATRGYLNADRALAEIYFMGNGVPINMDKALQYYWSAGIKGDHISQYHLGRFYALGIGGGVRGGIEGSEGVEKNEVQAYAWLDRAVFNGNKLAGPLLVTLHRTLDDNQRAQAKLLSDNLETGEQKWVPTPLNNPLLLTLLTPFTKPLPADQQIADGRGEVRAGSSSGQSRRVNTNPDTGPFKDQWQLHLGSHRDENSAIQAGKHLERIAPEALRGKKWATLLANGGTYKAKFYRLRLGGYSSFDGASTACENLIVKGFSCMVVNP